MPTTFFHVTFRLRREIGGEAMTYTRCTGVFPDLYHSNNKHTRAYSVCIVILFWEPSKGLGSKMLDKDMG